ncbi:MAG TPA: carbon-nitrogen hydrolase family protein [Bacteroidota bacterium]|nr:carbon-nitrogen hydrolase family protein [Bacteroidota bacterium]
MNSQIRISAAQLPTVVDGSSFAEKQRNNLGHVIEMLETAGTRKSDLVLFGEYANLHHRTWSDDRREYVADPIPGSFTKVVGEMARKFRMNVAMPVFGTFRGALSSWVVLFDRKGKIAGCYQKAHPTIPEQNAGIVAGKDLPVYKLDCVRVGIMTCMDIEYPEVAQVLLLKGAQLLLFPHVQGTWGEVDWEIRYRARAIDTGLPIVSACYGFPEGEWMPGKMIGRSSVIGRDGLVLADIGRKIGVLTCDLDLSAGRVTPFFFNEPIDRSLAVSASRRPELYSVLVDEEVRNKALRQAEKIRKQKK